MPATSGPGDFRNRFTVLRKYIYIYIYIGAGDNVSGAFAECSRNGVLTINRT